MTRKKEISDQDRERICLFYENGKTAKSIGELLGYNRTTVHAIIQKYLKTGSMVSDKNKNQKQRKITGLEIEKLKEWIANDCTVTLSNLQNKLLNERELNVSISTINRCIKEFNYSFKKIHAIPNRRNELETIEKRKTYAIEFMRYLSFGIDFKMIFIDEVGFNVSMRAGYGRSLQGTPAIQRMPHLRSRNISICCAMNKSEILNYKMQNIPFNAITFVDFLSELITTCKTKSINSGLFIMDNVRFHHSSLVSDLLNRNPEYSILFLPPYSPFLNPIENMFSKWKNIVKRGNPQDESMLYNLIMNGATLVNTNDCENYFRNLFIYLPRCIDKEIIED